MSKRNDDRVIPVNKNDDVELELTALNSDSQGVGRIDGYAVFVPGALAGESVEAHIIKVNPGYGIARLTRVITASPQRVAPVCPVYERCGGCTLEHLAYPEQLVHKTLLVQDALKRIGGFSDIEVEPALGMDEPWRYRNKGSFPIGAENGKAVFGFYGEKSHRIVPLDDCVIEDKHIVSIPRAVCEWANKYKVPAYDEVSGEGVLRHVMARVTATGELMAVVVTTGALPRETELIRALRDAGANTLIHNTNAKKTNVILGSKFRRLFGSGVITDELCGLRFRVSAASFLQVNHTQTERLYELALAGLSLTGGETVMDIYCGMGSISLLIARHAKKVVGIENVPAAVEDARANAELNGIENAEFICGDAETALPRLVGEGLHPDAVLVDPPRKGCDARALKAIADCNAKRLVYVSCDPGTLARDCKLLNEYGFNLESVQPVDMFPQTGHVETVVLMSRVDK